MNFVGKTVEINPIASDGAQPKYLTMKKPLKKFDMKVDLRVCTERGRVICSNGESNRL